MKKILTLALVVSAVAILIALDANSSVFGLVACAWGGFGAAFGPLLVFSLFWKRMTLQGAVAGMVTGGVVDLLWYYMKARGGIFSVYEIIPGFIASAVAIIIFS